MSEKQQEARLAEILKRRKQADLNMRLYGRYNGQDPSWADVDYLLSLLQQPTGERCGGCGDLGGLVFQFQCAAIQRHVLEPDHNTNWNECEFSSCAQARETLARYYERDPTPVQPPAAPQRTYRDRWCDHCKTTHRYFTGWANEGNHNDQLSNLQTEQCSVPEALPEVGAGSDAVAQTQRSPAAAEASQENVDKECPSGAVAIVPQPSAPTTGEGAEDAARAIVGTVFDNTSASYETLKATMIERITDYLMAHFPPTGATQVAVEAVSGFSPAQRLSYQEDTSMTKNYDGFRAGMLRAAEMARNEFKRAPEAAKGNDCVWMGGYESACDHLSVTIAQAAVIDSVRIAGSQPDWQYHVSLLLPDEGAEDHALLKIFQVVEHELRTARANAIRECVEAVQAQVGGYCSTSDGSAAKAEVVAALESLAKGEGDDGPTIKSDGSA